MSFNASNLNLTNLNISVIDPGNCFRDRWTVDTECILKTYCGQLDHYYVQTGIMLIIFFLVSNLAINWFLSKGYLRIKWDLFDQGQGFWLHLAKSLTIKMTFYPYSVYSDPDQYDLRILENRYELDKWIRHRIMLMFLIYVTVVVWLNLRVF
jgi:hypothetical protein